MFITAIGHADADGDLTSIKICTLHSEPKALGDDEQIFLAISISHCHKFLTAITIETQVKILCEFCQYFAKSTQTSVAGGVTVAVVEVLEAINIYYQNSGRFISIRSFQDCQGFKQLAAVE